VAEEEKKQKGLQDHQIIQDKKVNGPTCRFSFEDYPDVLGGQYSMFCTYQRMLRYS
jgi:hypothetical protein